MSASEAASAAFYMLSCGNARRLAARGERRLVWASVLTPDSCPRDRITPSEGDRGPSYTAQPNAATRGAPAMTSRSYRSRQLALAQYSQREARCTHPRRMLEIAHARTAGRNQRPLPGCPTTRPPDSRLTTHV